MFRLSVRDLAEFVYTSGDLGSISLDNERAWIGAQIHRDIQSHFKNEEKEIFLRRSDTLDGLEFMIEGRCDLLYQKDNHWILEEIKTTTSPIDKVKKDKVHEAQLLLYGAMIQHFSFEQLEVSLRYVHIVSKEEAYFKETYTKQQLEDFYLETLSKYVYWAKKKEHLHQRAIENGLKLTFPYGQYRPTQKQLCAAVYRSIKAKEPLFLQASTGIGKTISTLFPALKSIGNNTIDKIFYLCAKNVTAKTAIDTMHTINQISPFQTIQITAKDKICFLEHRDCDPDKCSYAKGYYERNKDAIQALLNRYDLITKQEVQEIGRSHHVCPFELSLDTLLYCDVIICDYNYAFDPKVYLKRCFDEKHRYTLLVDECHNLVDRSLSMYSSELQLSQLEEMKQVPCSNQNVLKAYHSLCDKMLDLYDQNQEYVYFEENDSTIIDACYNLQKHLQVYLRNDEQAPPQWSDLYFLVGDYLRIADYYDEHYYCLIHSFHGDVIIKQYCMNASNSLRKIYQYVHNVIFFSATLSPLRYYQNMLGASSEDKAYDFPSIFPKENTLSIIHRTLSTRYQHRDDTLLEVVECIYAAIMGTKGNYLVFAPSYVYLQAIYDLFVTLYPNFKTILQTSDQSEEDKQAFLQAFHSNEHHLVGFAILGGMFSEGIDYLGEQLIGSIIVSVGMGTPTKEKELMKTHFDALDLDGFSYAYRYPGMNKVLQAAGRVIRSAKDVGFILFLDERFATPMYLNLMPSFYRDAHYVRRASEILPIVSQFFTKT